MILPLSIVKLLPFSFVKKTHHATNTMREIIKKIMKERRIKIDNGTDESSDLLSLLMTAEHNDEKISDELIIDESFTFLFAGHDVN